MNATTDVSGLSPTQAAHKKRLQQIRDEASSIHGTVIKIAQAIDQVLANGGTINIQPQMAFVTGAHARMLKDLGVVEFLQSQGTVLKKPCPQR